MNAKHKPFVLCLFATIAFVLSLTSSSLATDYESLKGIESAKAVFDFRIANPKVAAVHLDLIHKMFRDQNLTINSKKPEIVVIFIGPAVKLVSNARTGFTPEEKKQLDAIAGIISDMAGDGIKLEICLVAAHLMRVDPASILPEVKKVGNGWISEIGYQHKGYALIPVF